MGKNLKGKECGKGICQRKDGRYYARFVTKDGKCRGDYFLMVVERQKFLEAAKSAHNFYQYALILDTGLRTGEMIGLTWDAIDWEKRTSPPTRPCVSAWQELLAGFV